MDDFKKISSNEWGAPYQGPGSGPLNGIEQRDVATDNATSVAAVLAKDEERQIQGVDIRDELEVSLDHASEVEEEDELAETEYVSAEAKANQG
jgi:hypothetical protein